MFPLEHLLKKGCLEEIRFSPYSKKNEKKDYSKKKVHPGLQTRFNYEINQTFMNLIKKYIFWVKSLKKLVLIKFFYRTIFLV